MMHSITNDRAKTDNGTKYTGIRDRSGQIYTCGIFYYFVPDMDSFEKSVSFYFLSYGSAGDIYKYP